MGNGSSATETVNSPWGPQGDQLKKLYSEAESLYQNPLEYFPGSTVGGRDRSSILARDATEGLGLADYRQSGQKYLGQVLGGDFMKEGSPHLDNMFDSMSNKVTESFNRAVMPGVNSRFAGSGRSGSSAHGLSMGGAQGQLADSLSDIGSKIYYGDYENRSRERMQGLGMMGAVQGLEYSDINQQRAGGAIEENYMQRLLDDSVNRFNFNQTEPENRLDRFQGRVAGNNGFGSTTTSGGGDGGASTGLGVLSMLTTLAGTAMGGVGGAVVGGLGGLGGAMGGGYHTGAARDLSGYSSTGF